MTELNCDAAPRSDRGRQANPGAASPLSRSYTWVLLTIVAIGLVIVLTRSAPEILALMTGLSKGTPL